MVELLAAVAIALTGQQVTLTCGPIPSDKPEIREHAVGIVTPDVNGGPPNITMLPWVCRSANRREHFGLKVLAHEILHVRPNKSEGWIREWDDWYAENVVRWKMRRISTKLGSVNPSREVRK